MEGQQKARAAEVRNREAVPTESRTLLSGREGAGRPRSEAAPIRYVAELVGANTDSERAILWLIALMVLTCDPLAIALMAAVSVARSIV